MYKTTFCHGAVTKNKLLTFLLLALGSHVQAFRKGPSSFNWNHQSRRSTSTSVTQNWSTPEECMRECQVGEPPKTCYYNFVVEFYTTVGAACNYCFPTNANQFSTVAQCECVIGDGMEKTLLPINRMLPGPSIQVCKGDQLVIDVHNAAEGMAITIHWHGIFQENSQYYDGVPFVTQCPILYANNFRYVFYANNSGTHFFHSHSSTHEIDGQYGSLIVRDPVEVDPVQAFFDTDYPEHTIVFSDWFHFFSIEKFPGLYRANRGQSAQNILINGLGNYTDPDTGVTTNAPLAIFYVESGKTHRMRLISAAGTVCLMQMTIEAHAFYVIAMDGESIEPVWVDGLIMGSGERYDIAVPAMQTPGSYWIQVRGIGECEEERVQQLAIIRYDNEQEAPLTPQPGYFNGVPYSTLFNPVDATRCPEPTPSNQQYCINQIRSAKPTDPALLTTTPDMSIDLPFRFFSYNDSLGLLFGAGSSKHFMVAVDQDHLISSFGNKTFEDPPSPLLSQKAGYEKRCNSTTPSTCTEPCSCTHTINIVKGSIVELCIIDQFPFDGLSHPFHLHGYAFEVFLMYQWNRNITKQDIDEMKADHYNRLKTGAYQNVPRKDTILVPQGGAVIIRFKADNPGWWLFHCHFLWHTATGMNLVLHVGEPSDLPPVPPNFPMCGDFTPIVEPPFE